MPQKQPMDSINTRTLQSTVIEKGLQETASFVELDLLKYQIICLLISMNNISGSTSAPPGNLVEQALQEFY
jgi:hypothetical protein